MPRRVRASVGVGRHTPRTGRTRAGEGSRRRKVVVLLSGKFFLASLVALIIPTLSFAQKARTQPAPVTQQNAPVGGNTSQSVKPAAQTSLQTKGTTTRTAPARRAARRGH